MSRAQICPLLLSVSLSVAGCASYSGLQGEAQSLAPQSLAFYQDRTGGDGPREDWWPRFGDPKLDTLMPQALQGNPSLRAAEARVRAARALADAAGASLYPSLGLEASATRERLSRNDIYPPPFGGSWVNQGRIALDLNYEFDFGGKHGAELEAAIGDARAASADAAQARLVLATAVAQAYFQAQTDVAAMAVARQTLARRESLLELNRVRTSRGLEAAIALRQSDQQIAASRVEVSAAEAAVQLDRHQLAALLGLGPDAPLEVEPALRQGADQVASVRAVQRQLADQANALAAAEDTYQLTLDRYRAGLTNYLDVLVNEERLLAERVNQVRLQGRSLALAVGTIRALGGGYHPEN